MTTERAVLAGGCFWGMQDLIRKLPGVISTRVGYTGGDVPNATYRNHGTHAEAIEISNALFEAKRWEDTAPLASASVCRVRQSRLWRRRLVTDCRRHAIQPR